MAVIRKTDLKAMDSNALIEKRQEIEKEIMAEKSNAKKNGKPKNPGKAREMKKVRARINTILNSRNADVKPQTDVAAKHVSFFKKAAKPAKNTPKKA